MRINVCIRVYHPNKGVHVTSNGLSNVVRGVATGVVKRNGPCATGGYARATFSGAVSQRVTGCRRGRPCASRRSYYRGTSNFRATWSKAMECNGCNRMRPGHVPSRSGGNFFVKWCEQWYRFTCRRERGCGKGSRCDQGKPRRGFSSTVRNVCGGWGRRRNASAAWGAFRRPFLKEGG